MDDSPVNHGFPFSSVQRYLGTRKRTGSVLYSTRRGTPFGSRYCTLVLYWGLKWVVSIFSSRWRWHQALPWHSWFYKNRGILPLSPSVFFLGTHHKFFQLSFGPRSYLPALGSHLFGTFATWPHYHSSLQLVVVLQALLTHPAALLKATARIARPASFFWTTQFLFELTRQPTRPELESCAATSLRYLTAPSIPNVHAHARHIPKRPPKSGTAYAPDDENNLLLQHCASSSISGYKELIPPILLAFGVAFSSPQTDNPRLLAPI